MVYLNFSKRFLRFFKPDAFRPGDLLAFTAYRTFPYKAPWALFENAHF